MVKICLFILSNPTSLTEDSATKLTIPSSVSFRKYFTVPGWRVLSGNDVIAKAPTGSGKTAAFAIPIIEKLDMNPENTSIQAIVLSPTRELAIQVHKEFEKLIPPLQDTEFSSLTTSILKYGCQEPIETWNGVIIDGHNRYKICKAKKLFTSMDSL